MADLVKLVIAVFAKNQPPQWFLLEADEVQMHSFLTRQQMTLKGVLTDEEPRLDVS
jgi:hypothetical protein